MRQIKIGNTTETVVERADFPPEKIKEVLGKESSLQRRLFQLIAQTLQDL